MNGKPFGPGTSEYGLIDGLFGLNKKIIWVRFFELNWNDYLYYLIFSSDISLSNASVDSNSFGITLIAVEKPFCFTSELAIRLDI